jgi:hypothetical protein
MSLFCYVKGIGSFKFRQSVVTVLIDNALFALVKLVQCCVTPPRYFMALFVALVA